MSEFDIIARHFTRSRPQGARVVLGIGDDCALLAPGPGLQLAISTDMLVAGRHFFADADPEWLGHKCLAVNLSDLAAMGARPLGFTLALSLPEANQTWLTLFAKGMFGLADQYHCDLIGGDTTRGPLNICITIFGELPIGNALQRNAAQIGDDIWISGTLGDARLALAALQNEVSLPAIALDLAAARLHRPSPRIALGLALQREQLAHAAIDLSDGLVGDLGHILARSGCGATLNVDALPCGQVLAQQPLALQRRFMLSGGDDYELCFTAPARHRGTIKALADAIHTPVSCIGHIEAMPGLRLIDHAGQALEMAFSSFDHFC
ncbi:MAG: thiamine-phosphate kinase [Pseudomonadota bacterium]